MSQRGTRRRFVSLAALLLLTGAHAVQAEEEQIYKWMDEKGQIHFTATPPPRNARPVDTKPTAKQPMQVVPMPGTSKPSSIAPSLVRPKQSSSNDLRHSQRASNESSERTDCNRHRGSIQRLQNAEQAVDSLRASIERLENDPVAARSSECSEEATRRGRCQAIDYNRDQELERARAQLEAAEDEVADAEGALRADGVPPECMTD